MNRFEFKNIVNSVFLSNLVLSSNDNYYFEMEEKYCFNGIEISFSGSYYAIIKGRIPLSVVSELYSDDTLDTSMIRFGEFGNGNPDDYAVDDIYKRDIKNIVDNFGDATTCLEMYESARKRLIRRKDKRKFIEGLYIEDKEILLLLLIKMRNYYNKKKNSNEKEECLALLDEVNKINYLADADLTPLNLEYLDISDERLRDNFFTWMCMIKRVVYNFDKVVNPYLNDEIALEDKLSYLHMVDVVRNCDAFSNELHITDKNTGNSVSYYKYNNTVTYEMSYLCLDGDRMNVKHVVSGYYEFGEKKIDDQLKITYTDSERVTTVRINLTNGQAFLGNHEVKLSNKLLKIVYEEMLNAVSFASLITIDNMKRKSRSLKK